MKRSLLQIILLNHPKVITAGMIRIFTTTAHGTTAAVVPHLMVGTAVFLYGSGWPKPPAEPSEAGSTSAGSTAWSSSAWTEGSYDWSDGSYDWSDGNRRLNNDDWESWSEANRGRARANSALSIVGECDVVSI